MKPIVSLSTDFGVQSQGIGIMEGTILSINPNAHVIHLMHGLPDFETRVAARTMETVAYLPVGQHVCVVDPGVGTERRGIIINTARGDHLIGPDNGVLITAATFLGGIQKVVEIANEKYMRQPVSPIFHGRDVFAPAAGHLSAGVPVEKFGDEIKSTSLEAPPYGEAVLEDDAIKAEVIHINKFGSLHFNILVSLWDKFKAKKNQRIILKFMSKEIRLPFVETFGQVPLSKNLIFKDDFGRIEVATNQGNFCESYRIKIGDKCRITKE